MDTQVTTGTRPVANTRPSRLPSTDWLRGMLRGRLELAATEQRYGATEGVIVRGSSYAAFAGGSWNFFHEPVRDKGQVVGYNVRLVQDVRGGFIPEDSLIAMEVLNELGYEAVRSRDGSTTGTLPLDKPFAPIGG